VRLAEAERFCKCLSCKRLPGGNSSAGLSRIPWHALVQRRPLSQCSRALALWRFMCECCCDCLSRFAVMHLEVCSDSHLSAALEEFHQPGGRQGVVLAHCLHEVLAHTHTTCTDIGRLRSQLPAAGPQQASRMLTRIGKEPCNTARARLTMCASGACAMPLLLPDLVDNRAPAVQGGPGAHRVPCTLTPRS